MYHEVTGDIICPSMVQGIDHIRDSRLNKVTFDFHIGNLEFQAFGDQYLYALIGSSVHFGRKTGIRYSRIDAGLF